MAVSRKTELTLRAAAPVAAVALAALWAGGCAIDAEPGTFLVDPAGVEAPLESGCSIAEAAGPFWITRSSFTGATYVAEPERNRVWIRNPLGVVSDHCYWVSTEADRPEWPEGNRPDCFTNGLVQDGSCDGEHHVPEGGGWTFVHGGFVEIPGLGGRVATADRLAVAFTSAGHPLLRVIDLVPDDDGCPDDQRSWGYHRLLYSLELPEASWGFAAGDLAVDPAGRFLLATSPEDSQLGVWPLPLPCEHEAMLPEPTTVDLGCAPDGPMAFDPAGDRVFVLCSGATTVVTVDGLGGDEFGTRRRVLSLRRPSDIAYEPVSDTVWVASPGAGKVRYWPADGGSAVTFSTPGATRLAVGETVAAGQRRGRVYATGSDPDGIYRLDPSTDQALFQALDGRPAALGAGTDVQELVTVTERPVQGGSGTSYVVRSFLDVDHLAAQRPDSLRLFAAAFLEYPRDPQLDDLSGQPQEVAVAPDACADMDDETIGWPGLDRLMYQLCCLQRARADQVTANLAYLERALLDNIPGEDRREMLFGINPTSLLQSSHCLHAALELERDVLAEMGLPFLEVVGEGVGALAERGDTLPVMLAHTAADSEDQVPYTCPELWRPDEEDVECDVVVDDQEAFVSFLGDLADTAALTRVAEPYQGTGGCGDGELPLPGGCIDPSVHAVEYGGLCGGFDRGVGLYTTYGTVSWPEAYAEVFPGLGEPFTYFGGAANYPYTNHAASKELAPWDARRRLGAFPVAADPAQWDRGGPDGPLSYLPGVTLAQTRLYELARSGMFVSDMFFHALADGEQWADDRWVGDESAATMGEADFAVLTHYLVYQVLAARDADAQRVMYFHLPDISAIALQSYPGGRVECTDPADCDSRDALQDWVRDVLPTLGPAVVWGLPEDFR